MASRRRTSKSSITGNLSDTQKRLKYLESRPAPAKLGNYSVKATNLQPRAVGTDQLGIGVVVQSTVGTDAIGNDELGIDSVDSENIRQDSIGTSELGLDAVYGENIITDAVGSSEIGSDAVNSSEIGSDAVGNSELGLDAVYGENIITDGVGSSEIGSDAVNSSEINADAVGTSELGIDAAYAENIAADAVGASEIGSDAVGASEIGPDVVGSAEIGPEAVGSSELGVDAVGNSELAPNSVSTENLQFGAVTNDKIFASSIEGTRIKPGTIQGNLHIQNGSILTDQIGNGQVTNLKLGSDISATKITAGTFADARIPGLPASKIDSGTFADARIPGLPASKIDSGIFAIGRIPTGGGSNQVALGNHTHTSGAVPAHTHNFIGGSITTASGNLSGHSHLGRDGSHLHGIQVSGMVGAVQTSTRRLKRDITDYTFDPQKLLNLQLKRYKYKNVVRDIHNTHNREWMYGYIAEDVLDAGIEEILVYDDENRPSALNYGLLSTLLLELVKSHQSELDSLREEVQRLKDKK